MGQQTNTNILFSLLIAHEKRTPFRA